MSVRAMSTVAGLLVLGALAAVAARADASGGADSAVATPAAASAQSHTMPGAPDLSGRWRIDPAGSTSPDARGGSAGGPPRGGARGGWGGRGGWNGGGRGGEGRRQGPGGPGGGGRGFSGRLPDQLVIDQVNGVVTLRDTSGTALQEIVTPATPDSLLPPQRLSVRRSEARLEQGKLEVERPLPMGGTLTETYALAGERHDRLEIRVHMQPEGGEARDFVRVYQRVATP